MNEAQYKRLEILKRYLEELESDYRLGKVSSESYRSELQWLSDRISELEDEVFPEVKRLRESPEMRSMRESAEDFFKYVGSIYEPR